MILLEKRNLTVIFLIIWEYHSFSASLKLTIKCIFPGRDAKLKHTYHLPLPIIRKKNLMDVWASILFLYEALLTGGDNLSIIGWLPL